MASVDLTGQIIGTTPEGLGEWVVVVKAPSQQRIRYWTTEHAACGTRVDLPQTMIQAAVKGKGSLPPCAACTPADELPAVSHGQHYACGTVHPIGTSCGKAGPGECKHAVKLHACPECGPLAGFEVIAPTADSVGGLVRRLPATPDAVEADIQAPEATAWSLDAIAEEPDVEPAPAAVEDDEPELEPLRLVPAVAAELAQAYAALAAAPDMKVNGHELVTATDDEISSVVLHPTAPVARVHGRVDRLEAPQDLLDVIRRAMAEHPRSQQLEVGPSEIGGCERKLGHRLAFGKAEDRDPDGRWRPQVGTYTHAGLDSVFSAAGSRWVSDYRITKPLKGHLDLYDALMARIVDFKITGQTTRDRAARGDVDDGYEVQLDVYGLGMEHDGYEVRSVALLLLPASGSLAEAVWYERPYDRERAWRAIARLQKVQAMLAVAAKTSGGVTSAADVVLSLLEASDDHCGYCPALGRHCPGAAVTPAAPALTFGGAA